MVDSISCPQLHKGFKYSWYSFFFYIYIYIKKLCLDLCSLKWLKPRRSSVISLIPLILWQLYTKLAVRLINWRIFFLNVRKLSELRRLGSNLFHSEIVDAEKEFLKKLCFDLKMGRLCIFLVVCGAILTRIKWEKYSKCWFLNISKKTELSVPTSKPKRF